MRAKILVMWDSTPWPKDHIYLCSVMEQEHEKLMCLVYPNRAGAWLWTKVLERMAGVRKTTLAMKVMLHWVEGFLFQYKFSYVFYISYYAVREMEDTTFAGPSLRPLLKSSWLIREVLVCHRWLWGIDCALQLGWRPAMHRSASVPPRDQNPVPLFEATLLITTRDCRSKDLKKLDPWFVLILRFTEEDWEDYSTDTLGTKAKPRKSCIG